MIKPDIFHPYQTPSLQQCHLSALCPVALWVADVPWRPPSEGQALQQSCHLPAMKIMYCFITIIVVKAMGRGRVGECKKPIVQPCNNYTVFEMCLANVFISHGIGL